MYFIENDDIIDEYYDEINLDWIGFLIITFVIFGILIYFIKDTI